MHIRNLELAKKEQTQAYCRVGRGGTMRKPHRQRMHPTCVSVLIALEMKDIRAGNGPTSIQSVVEPSRARLPSSIQLACGKKTRSNELPVDVPLRAVLLDTLRREAHIFAQGAAQPLGSVVNPTCSLQDDVSCW